MPHKSELEPVEVADTPFPPRLLATIWAHFCANPDKIALINAKQREHDFVTYGELYMFSIATATFLHRHHGFGRGDIACLALPNCWEYATIFLGVTLTGGAISGANPMFTDKELQQQFSDSQCKIVFCSPENLPRVLRTVPCVKQIVLVESGQSKVPPIVSSGNSTKSTRVVDDNVVVQFGQVIRTEPTALFGHAFSMEVDCQPASDILLLPYSSGTTGSPKGVMTSHRNFGTMMNIFYEHFRLYVHQFLRPAFVECEENELLLLPFFHCYGFGMLVLCLLYGSTGLVMAGFEADLFCKTIQDFKIRFLKLVPPILVFLAKIPIVERYDLSCVHCIFSGAAPAGADLCDELKKRFPALQHVCQGYGMTEMTIATHLPVLDKVRHESTGKLVANLEMKIVDVDCVPEREAEQGMPGEVRFRGPTVMLGYLHRPEETTKTIDSDGWLRSGDIGFLDKDGFITIIDRLKELIKVNGLQVAPAELEDLLLTHSDIQDCAVVGVPDPVSGELPMALVVRRSGSKITELDVKEFVKTHAIYYKHLRGGVQFVEQIPKSPSGKILRRLVRDRIRKERAGGAKVVAMNEEKQQKQKSKL